MNSSCFDFSMLLAKYVENGSRLHMASGNWFPSHSHLTMFILFIHVFDFEIIATVEIILNNFPRVQHC